MINIHTHSLSLTTKEFWKWVVRRIVGKYSGPNAVEDSLLRGLKELQIPFRRNTRIENKDTVIVLSGIKALQEAIEAKRKGGLNKLVAGPNVIANPHDADRLMFSKEIDAILVPSKWVAELWTKEAPELASKIKVWPAGVSKSKTSTRAGTPIIYDKLGDASLFSAIQQTIGTARIFSYGTFKHRDYLTTLADAPYLVYLAQSESQGLALQEAWAHDVPTLVNRSNFWQGGELSWEAPQINCPYLTPELGEIFDNPTDIPIMIERIASLHPKAYCDKELSDQASANKLLEIIKNIHVQNS